MLWFGTKMMGCAEFLCPRLSVPGGDRYPNAQFLMCIYGPQFFSSASGKLFTQSPTGCEGRDARCTDSDRQTCVKFQSGGDESSLTEVGSIGGNGFRAGSYCGELSKSVLYLEQSEDLSAN